MPLEQQTGLRKPDPDVKNSFQNSLVYTSHLYDIPQTSLNNSPSTVSDVTMRLLEGYDMDPSFGDDPEKCLFALAIGNEWITATYNERKSLLDVLKVIAYDEPENENLSGKVRDLSIMDISRGLYFDPIALGQGKVSWDDERDLPYEEYDSIYRNAHLSEKIAEEFRSSDSLLQDVRNRLGLNTETETPYKVTVLNKTSSEMDSDVGGAAWCFLDKECEIVLARNFTKSQAEHEYAHTQSKFGVMSGFRSFLFRGLNEAITESLVSQPSTYKEQRLMQGLILNIPGSESLLLDAYMNPDLKIPLYSALIKRYELSGFLAAARLNTSSEQSIPLENSIYLSASKVLNLMCDVELPLLFRKYS